MGADGRLVASADFKSVVAAREHRWVGSIPTRSRQIYNSLKERGLRSFQRAQSSSFLSEKPPRFNYPFPVLVSTW